jgi:hypothetical protein
MTRETLPNKRFGETFEITHRDQPVSVTVSRFADGRVAEVFAREWYGSGTALEAEARDASVLLSLALQFGMPLETARRALSRYDDGRPCGVIGAVVDALTGETT